MAYSSTTQTVEINVTPVFIEDRSSPEDNMYFWAYTVVVQNRGKTPVQLKSRFWRITDGQGRVQEVRGSGVVGEQPTIPPGASFEYTSGCPLNTPSGLMTGEYTMMGDDGKRFNVTIPLFSLDSPYADGTLN